MSFSSHPSMYKSQASLMHHTVFIKYFKNPWSFKLWSLFSNSSFSVILFKFCTANAQKRNANKIISFNLYYFNFFVDLINFYFNFLFSHCTKKKRKRFRPPIEEWLFKSVLPLTKTICQVWRRRVCVTSVLVSAVYRSTVCRSEIQPCI